MEDVSRRARKSSAVENFIFDGVGSEGEGAFCALFYRYCWVEEAAVPMGPSYSHDLEYVSSRLPCQLMHATKVESYRSI